MIEKNIPKTQDERFGLEPLDDVRIERVLGEFGQKYRRHDKGLFILAPSGAGKSHYVREQATPDWIDGDTLWTAAGAHPDREWWLESLEVIQAIDAKCDEITKRAKEKGFWIMGASNNGLLPDAIVIPDWEKHKAMIKYREEHNYDGGAKTDRLDQVLGHREWMLTLAKQGIPVFPTIEAATRELSSHA
jgi:hypothetical protein